MKLTSFCFYSNKSTNSNFSPSKSPKSLSFRAGITNRAINDRLINGEISVLPSWSFTKSVNHGVAIGYFIAIITAHQASYW